jgi:hypothetical protein
MVLDYLHIRRETTCCLCGAHKNRGMIACWVCFMQYDLDNPSPLMEDVMQNLEQSLVESEKALR